jgi:hypothetical protein
VTVAGPRSGARLALLTVSSVLAGGVLAYAAGLVLGEYTFSGPGIQWVAMSGGLGVGAAMAWTHNRIWRGAPPLWMAAVSSVLAIAGEALAVHRDTAPGDPWPPEGWAAVAAAGIAAAYGVLAAYRSSTRERAQRG